MPGRGGGKDREDAVAAALAAVGPADAMPDAALWGEDEDDDITPLEVDREDIEAELAKRTTPPRPNAMLPKMGQMKTLVKEEPGGWAEVIAVGPTGAPSQPANSRHAGSRRAGSRAPSGALSQKEGSALRRLTSRPWVQAFLALMAVFLYIMAGGAIYRVLEYDDEQERIEKITADFWEAVEEWESLNLDSMVANMTEGRHTAESLLTAYADGAALGLADEGEIENPWNFASATLFASTIVTTVGYGSYTPQSRGGRGFYPVYALVGIALFGVWLGTLTNMLQDRSRKLSIWLHKRFGWKRLTINVGFAITVCVAVMVVFVYLSSLIFMHFLDLDYQDAMYFTWVSVTTVGFGDISPGREPSWRKNMLGVFWLLLALGFVAVLINYVALAGQTAYRRSPAFTRKLAEAAAHQRKALFRRNSFESFEASTTGGKSISSMQFLTSMVRQADGDARGQRVSKDRISGGVNRKMFPWEERAKKQAEQRANEPFLRALVASDPFRSFVVDKWGRGAEMDEDYNVKLKWETSPATGESKFTICFSDKPPPTVSECSTPPSSGLPSQGEATSQDACES